MEKGQFLRILQKYIEGTATEEESKLIEAYYNLLLSKSKLESAKNEKEDEEFRKELFGKIRSRIREKEQVNVKVIRSLPKVWKTAAAFVILIGCGIIFYITRTKQGSGGSAISAIEQKNKTDQIKPGGNIAVLTLANGEKIPLDSTSNGSLAKQGNVHLIKLNSGQLRYKRTSEENEKDQTLYNTLSTPRGGQYEVILPDGTKVWLNAVSSLHYPVAFTGKTRTVEIKGEGYFKVAPDAKKPFIVKVGHVKIEVLGTRFNVNSYEDEDNVKATLENGSIRVTKGEKRVLLKPGEEVGFNKRTGVMKVGVANLTAAIAWKNGLFYFHNTNIKEIMKQVSRWYNVKVTYETHELDHKSYSGTLPRYSDVSALLKMLEMTGTVHFKIRDRTIIVMD